MNDPGKVRARQLPYVRNKVMVNVGVSEIKKPRQTCDLRGLHPKYPGEAVLPAPLSQGIRTSS